MLGVLGGEGNVEGGAGGIALGCGVGEAVAVGELVAEPVESVALGEGVPPSVAVSEGSAVVGESEGSCEPVVGAVVISIAGPRSKSVL